MVLRAMHAPNDILPSSPPDIHFKGAPGFYPATSQDYKPPSSLPSSPVSCTANIKIKQEPRCSPHWEGRVEEGDTYTLRQWLLRDESIARCSVDQAKSLRQEDADLFYLDTFPCRRIEVVGIVVGIDIRENRTTYMIDDGSSVTMDVVYDHNTLKTFQRAQERLKDEAQRDASSSTRGPSSTAQKTEQCKATALPAFAHVSAIEMGDTVRVRARVKKWGVSLVFSIDADLAPVFPNDEVVHASLVDALSTKVYPSFSQPSYLASSLAPRPPTVPAPAVPPCTPSKRSTRPSSSTFTIQSGQGFSSELDYSDLPSSGQPSSALGTPTFNFASSSTARRSEYVDKISSKSCSKDGLKLRLKGYMVDLIEAAWSVDGLRSGPSQPPVSAWLPELSKESSGVDVKGKARAQHDDENLDANFSSSFDISMDSNFNSAIYIDTASFIENVISSSLRSDSAAPPAPPFSIAHFMRTRDLRVYGTKVVKRLTEEAHQAAKQAFEQALKTDYHRVKSAARTKYKSADRWYYDGDGIGRERDDPVEAALQAIKQKRSRPPNVRKKLLNDDWRDGKLRNLFRQCLNELEREGEVVRVGDALPRNLPALMPPSPSFFPPSPSVRSKPTKVVKHDYLYLPLSLPVLAPILVDLLQTENACLNLKPGATQLDGSLAPFGTSTRSLHRRLLAADARWECVTEWRVEEALKELDSVEDLVEKQRGGWRVILQ